MFSFGNLEFHSFYFFIIENFAFFLEKKNLEAPCLSQPEPNPNSLKDELDMVVVKKSHTTKNSNYNQTQKRATLRKQFCRSKFKCSDSNLAAHPIQPVL